MAGASVLKSNTTHIKLHAVVKSLALWGQTKCVCEGVGINGRSSDFLIRSEMSASRMAPSQSHCNPICCLLFPRRLVYTHIHNHSVCIRVKTHMYAYKDIYTCTQTLTSYKQLWCVMVNNFLSSNNTSLSLSLSEVWRNEISPTSFWVDKQRFRRELGFKIMNNSPHNMPFYQLVCSSNIRNNPNPKFVWPD